MKSEWRYEATSGAIKLGLDTNNAHVQPNGSYHYHALPRDLETELELKSENLHSPLIGWAADGFPIYAATGYTENKQSLINKSRYILKQGKRETGKSNPDGIYDVTFINYFYSCDVKINQVQEHLYMLRPRVKSFLFYYALQQFTELAKSLR